MIIIVGLGNPGKKYKTSRHNVGFLALDKIAATFQFPPFKFQSIFNAQISKNKINGENIILVKPQTFMNNSGKTVKSLLKNNNPDHQKLIVIHDDIDIPLGKIRIVKNRGAAGHKGVESIIKELKTKDFVRFRIGIKPPSIISTIVKNINHFVLEEFSKNEEKIVKEAIKKTAEAIEFSLKQGLEKAMNKYNK